MKHCVVLSIKKYFKRMKSFAEYMLDQLDIQLPTGIFLCCLKLKIIENMSLTLKFIPNDFPTTLDYHSPTHRHKTSRHKRALPQVGHGLDKPHQHSAQSSGLYFKCLLSKCLIMYMLQVCNVQGRPHSLDIPWDGNAISKHLAPRGLVTLIMIVNLGKNL